jgi:hypothetical protein
LPVIVTSPDGAQAILSAAADGVKQDAALPGASAGARAVVARVFAAIRGVFSERCAKTLEIRAFFG